MEIDYKMVKPSKMANLKTKLEELEKAVDEMERSQRVVQTLGNKVEQYMTSQSAEEGFCKECCSQFKKKLVHICGRIDETDERSGDLSELSEELWADMEEYFFIKEREVPCQGGHTK